MLTPNTTRVSKNVGIKPSKMSIKQGLMNYQSCNGGVLTEHQSKYTPDQTISRCIDAICNIELGNKKLKNGDSIVRLLSSKIERIESLQMKQVF